MKGVPVRLRETVAPAAVGPITLELNAASVRLNVGTEPAGGKFGSILVHSVEDTIYGLVSSTNTNEVTASEPGIVEFAWAS